MSWFETNPVEQQTNAPRSTRRASLSIPTEQNSQRTSVDKTSKRTQPPIYSTPHDAILAKLQSGPRTNSNDPPSNFVGEDANLFTDVESATTRDDKLRSKSDLNLLSVTPTPSLHGSRGGMQDLLLDPFDGNVLGVLIPNSSEGTQNDIISSSQPDISDNTDAVPNVVGATGELVWSHLSRILDLQSRISKMHIDMEGIGSSKGLLSKSSKPSHHRSTYLSPEDPVLPPGLDTRKRVVNPESAHSSGDEEEHEKDEFEVHNEEAERNRIREEEFAKLASQFQGRKEAIQDIMGKLDDLSKALSEFHELQAPQIDVPGSRQNSLNFTSPITSHSPFNGDEHEVKTNLSRVPFSQSSAPPPSRTYDWSNQTASTSTPILSVPLTRTKSENTTISAPPKPTQQHKLLPTVLITSADPETQVMDSPVSTVGSLKLLPEE